MKLADYLKEKKLTQREFAKIIGVEQACINYYLKGKRKPIKRIARIIEEKTCGLVKKEDLVFNPEV